METNETSWQSLLHSCQELLDTQCYSIEQVETARIKHTFIQHVSSDDLIIK